MSNETKQTAVEFIIDKLSNYDKEILFLFEQEIEQAKEMEKEQMCKFLEIKSIHGNIVLININQIAQISEGISVDYNFIYLIDGDCTNTHETIEEIKAKL